LKVSVRGAVLDSRPIVKGACSKQGTAVGAGKDLEPRFEGQ